MPTTDYKPGDPFYEKLKESMGFYEYASCKNCKMQWDWKLNDMIGKMTTIRCPACNAGLDGKVYPKKRETPRVVTEIVLQPNDELDKALASFVTQHPKTVEDYKSGKPQAVGFLVGQYLKINKHDPRELKQRIEKILKELV